MPTSAIYFYTQSLYIENDVLNVDDIVLLL